jgi:hypothetical protein
MAAQIVKRPHHTILSAQDHRALSQKIKAAPVTRGGYVIDMTRHLPVVQEQMVLFQHEHGFGMIGPGGQAASVPCFGDHAGYRRRIIHAFPSINARTHW